MMGGRNTGQHWSTPPAPIILEGLGSGSISWMSLDPGRETEKPLQNFQEFWRYLFEADFLLENWRCSIFSYVWDGTIHRDMKQNNGDGQLCKYEDVTLTIRHQDCYMKIDLACGLLRIRHWFFFADISAWCHFRDYTLSWVEFIA